jgi:uracil-DNA glycosylase
MSTDTESNNIIRSLISELDPEWQRILLKNINTSQMDYITELYFESSENKVFPPKKNLFEAFKYFKPSETKVVILGQDPYPTEGQAHGLAFSVQDGVRIPRSLCNIYSELKHEFPELVGCPQLSTGNLTRWAYEGVLLLNTALTVPEGKANAHAKFWRSITDGIIADINECCEGIVFMLWGNNAKKKEKLINTDKNYIFKCAHPSPLSANRGDWFYNSQFQLCNIYLELRGKEGIKWLY